ncbi:type II toxin-antitoxin system HipA family toxin [Neisseriaceae bacterium B1]
MNRLNNVKKLNVYRTLSTGQRVEVGVLAQNSQGVYFQYREDYLRQYGNLSPFRLQADSRLQATNPHLHNGLHGVFADCLPDGWGLLLQDRFFRQQGIMPSEITAMDRLAFVGNRAIGALGFEPQQDWGFTAESLGFAELGLQAQAVFDGQTEEILTTLIAAGSSGGARSKAQLYTDGDLQQISRTVAQQGDSAWIVKFTSRNLPLGHDEGLCEAVYLHMAAQAGIYTQQWQLLPAPAASGAQAWLAVKRFDWLPENQGRLHQISAAGLLDADFRLPSLDYGDLIKATKLLTKDTQASQQQFRRAMFNLFAVNQDDHSKNWAFLQQDSGQWQPAPFYDATFSPQKFGEHATAFLGQGKNPPLKTVQKLADIAGFNTWHDAQQVIQEVLDSLAEFDGLARDYGVSAENRQLIQRYLDESYQGNKDLIK